MEQSLTNTLTYASTTTFIRCLQLTIIYKLYLKNVVDVDTDIVVCVFVANVVQPGKEEVKTVRRQSVIKFAQLKPIGVKNCTNLTWTGCTASTNSVDG